MIVFVHDPKTLCIGLRESDVQQALAKNEMIVADNDGIRKHVGPMIMSCLSAGWNGLIIVSINNTEENELAMVRRGCLVIPLNDDLLEWAREPDGIVKGDERFRVSLKIFDSELALYEFAMGMQQHHGARIYHSDKIIHPN